MHVGKRIIWAVVGIMLPMFLLFWLIVWRHEGFGGLVILLANFAGYYEGKAAYRDQMNRVAERLLKKLDAPVVLLVSAGMTLIVFGGCS